MAVIYTTADGKAYTAGDGTLLVISPAMARQRAETPEALYLEFAYK